MLKSSFLAVFLLLLASPCFSQISWQALNGPSGAASLQFMATDQSGRIFLRHNQELFSSTDNGTTWQSSNSGIPANEISSSSIIVLPNGNVIAQTYYNVYKYNPADNTWSIDGSISGYGPISVDDQQRLWRVEGEDIYYSTNGGQTFVEVLGGDQTEGWHEEMANHNDQHNLVAVAYGTLAKLYHFTTSGNVTLVPQVTQLIDFLSYSPLSGTAFLSGYDGTMRSTDGGLSWQNIELKIDPTDNYPAQINRLYYESATKILAWSSKGLFTSEDDGATWTSYLYDQFQYISNFYKKPDHTFFISQECSENDFIRSTDLGQTWMDISEQFKYPSISEVQVAKNNVIFAQNCYYYERSTDGGQNWTMATAFDSIESPIGSLAVLPDGDLFSFSGNGHILHSTDGGSSWTLTSQPPTSPFWGGWMSTIKADLFGNVYALYEYSKAYKSTDKGQTWTEINYIFSATNTSGPLFTPNGDIYSLDYYTEHYVAAQDTVIYENVLFPNGDYPDFRSSAVTAQGDLLFTSANLSTGQTNLYRYKSNEEPELLNFPGSYPTLINTTSDGLTFLVSYDSIFQSDNSGLQWTFTGKLPANSASYYNLQSINAGLDHHLYLSYYQNVVYRSSLPIIAPNKINGVAWLDLNNNCLREPNELPLTNNYIKAEGNGDYGGYSYTDGHYQIFAPEGTYQVSATPPNALFAACPPVSVTLNGPLDTAHADVALQAVVQCPYLRISASTPLLRRCFPNTYTVKYANEGTATATGAYVEITLDSLFEFQAASVVPSSQNGQVLTFAIGDLQPGASGQMQIQIKVSCEAAIQQTHCFKAQIFPSTPCLPGLADLSVTEECRMNIGSFDPNDKRAFVNGQENPATTLPDATVEYLIRFQNTGTDTAFTVVVEDRISGVLDLSSVVPLVSSHPYRMELGADRNLRFIFDHILLPDSNINVAASQGFIKFAIKQLPNLSSGTAIRNTAAIFFDFNAEVITNTSEIIVDRPTPVYEPVPGYSIQVFPNPFHDLLNFKVSGPTSVEDFRLMLTDALGRIISQQTFTDSELQLSRKDLPAGMYFYAVLDSQGRWIAAGRVIAE